MNYRWLIVAALAVATFFLFFGAPQNLNAVRSIKEAWNLGHIVYFALFTYLLNLSPWLKDKSILRRWSLSLLVTLLLGVAIEVLQYGTERSPDLADISRNLVGALLVLAFAPGLSVLMKPLWRTTSRLMVSVVFLLHLVPLSWALFDEAMARARFPVLSDFSTALELDRWKGDADIERVQLQADREDFQLKVNLSTDLYSGAGMQYFPSDWHGFTYVNLRFFQPLSDYLDITVRIHDAWHNNHYNDRFNRTYRLQQGWTEIRIPLSEVKTALQQREMDLARISDISFFSIRLPYPRPLFLDKIYLNE